jgi:hypothetical protein
MNIQGDTDKIVLESGEKNITNLLGEKYGGSTLLYGTVGKSTTLTGYKNIDTLSGLKNLSVLNGLKYLLDLLGKKYIDTLIGDTDKQASLFGEAIEGYWHIYVDSTYYFADSTIIKADRN